MGRSPEKSRSSHTPFRRVTIVGIGLIGGSLALAIKRRFPAVTVIGVDRPAVLRRAVRRKAIDEGFRSISSAVRNADLVILATPLRSILNHLLRVQQSASPSALVTDVGSVKGAVMQEAARLFPRGNFIGGHPMAGVELSGIDAAHPLLFENAVYVLTPLKQTPRRSLLALSRFLSGLGPRTMVMDAGVHDRVAAVVSHLPQLTAVALMNVAGKRHLDSRNHLRLAAGGFRDITRIASSRFGLWSDILEANAAQIEHAIDLLIRELDDYRRDLQRSGRTRTGSHFRQAARLRNTIPKSMKGFLHPLSDLYVFVPDKPGMLAKLTTAMAQAGINIKDLELVKVREGAGGTFRLSFDGDAVANRAARLLRRKGFEVEE
ncbi:MAG: prephenate dehydrogenase [Bacteroidota bacterium]